LGLVRSFPSHFLFGAATSAYQIEGGITNDWTQWEEAGRLKDPRARCGRATDHWNRWEEDFELLASLGANAYRMSIEWSRIEPRPGEYDDAALSRYAAMIDRLRSLGIEPFVTLLHFTHPPWFHETCAWHSRDTEAPVRFARFVEHVAGRIADRVRFWTVINEPSAWLSGAYLAGIIPPGQRGMKNLGRAFASLVRAHAMARSVLKRIGGASTQVGVAHNVMRFVPARGGSLADRLIASYASSQYNHAFLRALATGRVRLGVLPGLRMVANVPEAVGTLDFIGINYYSRVFVKATPFSKSRIPVEPFYEDRGGLGMTDLGWEIHPRGLTELLVEMSTYGLPMYVTENGLDDRDDSRRAAFIHDHLGAVLEAIDRGADIRGYLHWSLIDNFEWLESYGPRFGLFSVDYETLARKPTRSAEIYQEIIQRRALPDARPEARIKRGTQPIPVF
jgi:beta-glucosidase